MTPDAARPRSVRGGTARLTLVPSPGEDTDTKTTDTQPPVTDAVRHRRLSVAGSATVRALIALGALSGAVGIPVSRADAVYKSHEEPDRVEADPGSASLVDTAPPARAAAHTVTASAGSWAPAHTTTVAYRTTPKVTAGTGRHRKAHSSGDHKPVRVGSGRHRRPGPPTVTAHRPVTAAVASLKVTLSGPGVRLAASAHL